VKIDAGFGNAASAGAFTRPVDRLAYFLDGARIELDYSIVERTIGRSRSVVRMRSFSDPVAVRALGHSRLVIETCKLERDRPTRPTSPTGSRASRSG
jgi:hypothetical protein